MPLHLQWNWWLSWFRLSPLLSTLPNSKDKKICSHENQVMIHRNYSGLCWRCRETEPHPSATAVRKVFCHLIALWTFTLCSYRNQEQVAIRQHLSCSVSLPHWNDNTVLILSTLPSPGYSTWNGWNGGWIPEVADGFHGMGGGFHTFGWWIPYFCLMDSILLPDGFHTFAWWIPYFWLMDSILLPDGFHTFAWWIPYFSTWNP